MSPNFLYSTSLPLFPARLLCAGGPALLYFQTQMLCRSPRSCADPASLYSPTRSLGALARSFIRERGYSKGTTSISRRLRKDFHWSETTVRRGDDGRGTQKNKSLVGFAKKKDDERALRVERAPPSHRNNSDRVNDGRLTAGQNNKKLPRIYSAPTYR